MSRLNDIAVAYLPVELCPFLSEEEMNIKNLIQQGYQHTRWSILDPDRETIENILDKIEVKLNQYYGTYKSAFSELNNSILDRYRNSLDY